MTNVNLERAEQYLIEMSDLLADNGCSLFWADQLKSLAAKKTMHPDDFRSQIKSLFGGMGSLTDLVICKSDGTMDRELNIVFDVLRQKLYDVI